MIRPVYLADNPRDNFRGRLVSLHNVLIYFHSFSANCSIVRSCAGLARTKYIYQS
jgi:hypothetical protein